MTRQNSYPYSHNESYATRYFQENSNEISSDLSPSNESDDHDHLKLTLAYKKRLRTKFSQEQLDILEATFQQHHYPTVDVIDDLVERLDLPTQKITVWFQNRRARLKKSQPKGNETKLLSKNEAKQYDSGIQLDDEISHDSTSTSSTYTTPVPPPPAISAPIVPSHFNSYPSYYPMEAQSLFYPPMWQNFSYSIPSPSFEIGVPEAMSNPLEVLTPFVAHDITNYSYQREFDGEL